MCIVGGCSRRFRFGCLDWTRCRTTCWWWISFLSTTRDTDTGQCTQHLQTWDTDVSLKALPEWHKEKSGKSMKVSGKSWLKMCSWASLQLKWLQFAMIVVCNGLQSDPHPLKAKIGLDSRSWKFYLFFAQKIYWKTFSYILLSAVTPRHQDLKLKWLQFAVIAVCSNCSQIPPPKAELDWICGIKSFNFLLRTSIEKFDLSRQESPAVGPEANPSSCML